MEDLISDLLKYLNQGKILSCYPRLFPVTSLDEIIDGETLITVTNDDTVNLMRDIRVNYRSKRDIICLDCSRNADTLKYSVKEGCLVFERIAMSTKPGVGLISDDYANNKNNKAYILL